jgi:hypothetical protein
MASVQYDYYLKSQQIAGEFHEISLQSPSAEVCAAAKAGQEIVAEFATREDAKPPLVSSLKEVIYVSAKAVLPSAVQDLASKVDKLKDKFSQAIDSQDVEVVFNPEIVNEAAALREQHATLASLFKETLEIQPAGIFACFVQLFTYLFYTLPVQKQIAKIEAALKGLEVLEAAHAKKCEAMKIEAFSYALDQFEKDITAFETRVCTYPDVIFPTSFIDDYGKLQKREIALSRQLRALKGDPETLRILFNKHLQVFLKFSNLYDAMSTFQALHGQIQYYKLEALASGSEAVSRHQKKQIVISDAQIKRALKYSFAWKKLAQFADMVLLPLLRNEENLAPNSSSRIYIQKLKALAELIPGFDSPLLEQAVTLDSVLHANENPRAVADTLPPPKVEATVPLCTQPVEISRVDRALNWFRAKLAS